MSLYDYEEAKRIAAQDFSFCGLIMAAMRKADTDNLARLQSAWPDVWVELQVRYDAPGGMLDSEREISKVAS